jgi:hypothetical protein
MADPVSLAAISIGTSALGAGVSAYGSLQSGAAKSQMYQYQAGISRQNAVTERQNASFALDSGESQALASGMKTRAQVGKTIARQGASNIAVGSGSNAEVVKSEGLIGAMDQATIRTNAGRAAYGFYAKATQDEEQANIYGMSAGDATQAGEIGAATSLLSGASSVSSKWSQGSQSGLFS